MSSNQRPIAFRNGTRWLHPASCLVLLESLANGDTLLAASMTLDTVDQLIDVVIEVLENARDKRFLVELNPNE